MAGLGTGQGGFVPVHPQALLPLLAAPTTPQDTGNFVALQETDVDADGTPLVVTYQTITFNWPHKTFSLEELRLNDYTHERGLVSRALDGSRPKRGFKILADGLVAVSLPNCLSRKHDSCRAPSSLDIELGSEIVTIRVGKEGEHKDFAIHQNVITRRSAFVREALKGEWKEATSRIITLPDDDPKVLGLYQKWLYSGCIFQKKPSVPKQSRRRTGHETLVLCYTFGEKLLDGTFKDCVIDTIISLVLANQSFDPRLTSRVYDGTPPNSPLRKLWQDIYIFCGSSSWLDDCYDVHPEFLLDLGRRQMSFWKGVKPQDGAKVLQAPCSYHEHEGGKCYRVSSVPLMDFGGGQGVVSALWS